MEYGIPSIRPERRYTPSNRPFGDLMAPASYRLISKDQLRRSRHLLLELGRRKHNQCEVGHNMSATRDNDDRRN